MKNETDSVAIEKLVRLTSTMYMNIYGNSEHKKEESVNRNVVATIIHKEYRDVLLNNKCVRHPINRIQSKDLRTGIYEINKISLSFFDDRIYISKKVDMMD